MKKVIQFLAVSMLLSSISFAQGYNLKIRVDGVSDTVVYLAHYLGSKLYYTDTAFANNKGEFRFKKKKSLPGGKYAVVIPGPKFFEVLIDEQQFEMETRADDLIMSMEVRNSPNNKIYYDYVKFINDKKKVLDKLNEDLVTFSADSAKSREISLEIVSLNNEVKDRQISMVTDNGDKWVGQIMKMGEPLNVPDAPKNEKGEVTDSLFQYYWFKQHFFDNIDLNDPRIARTPEFQKKLEEYFSKVIPQVPDSLMKDSDIFIKRIDHDPELFKMVVHYLTSTYEKSKIVCMDKFFVHLIETYYMTKRAVWMDSTGIAKITERALTMKPTLCGQKAPYMNLHDTSETIFTNLYDVNADFTIIYIWSPDCGHCKKSNPKLARFANEYKDKGVKVYAVGNPHENEEWIEYLKTHPDFADLINVSDSPKYPSAFRTFYDVHTTPKVYVLDKDKKIIAKQIDVDQLGEVIDHFIKIQGTIN